MGYFAENRPLKNCSDISLMDDNQNEWGEEEPSDTKRFRVSRATLLTGESANIKKIVDMHSLIQLIKTSFWIC